MLILFYFDTQISMILKISAANTLLQEQEDLAQIRVKYTDISCEKYIDVR